MKKAPHPLQRDTITLAIHDFIVDQYQVKKYLKMSRNQTISHGLLLKAADSQPRGHEFEAC